MRKILGLSKDSQVGAPSIDSTTTPSASTDGLPPRPPLPEHVAKAKKRRAVAEELLETEKRYLAGLVKLLEVYEKPLLEAVEAGKPIIPKDKITQLFGKVPEICSVSRQLVERFEAGDVAESFTYLAPFIHGVYADYARNYEAVMKQIKLQTSLNQEFREFLAVAGQACMEGVEALLITPIQRVPRYKMLLENLIKYTPEGDAEHPGLCKALETVSFVAHDINEKIREYENEQRVISIGRRLFGKEVPPIAVPGRKILKEGWLEKRSRQEPTKTNWRYVFLFNDIMIYGVAMHDNFSSTVVGGAGALGRGVSKFGHAVLPTNVMEKAHGLKVQIGKTAANYLESDSPSLTCYAYKRQLQLSACAVGPSDEDGGSWLRLREGVEEFELKAATPDDRDGWLNAIGGAIKGLAGP